MKRPGRLLLRRNEMTADDRDTGSARCRLRRRAVVRHMRKNLPRGILTTTILLLTKSRNETGESPGSRQSKKGKTPE